MNSIPYRRLQRMTVKDLNEQIPCYVTVRGTPKYILKSSDDSQPPIKNKKTIHICSQADCKLCNPGLLTVKEVPEIPILDTEESFNPAPKPSNVSKFQESKKINTVTEVEALVHNFPKSEKFKPCKHGGVKELCKLCIVGK